MLFRVFAIGCAAITAACVSGGAPNSVAVSDTLSAGVETKAPRPSGLAYAEKACGACHAVAPGASRSSNPKAPTFEVIANTPGMTPMALNVWLHSSPHRDMPYVQVEPDQLDALADYVYSLRR